MVRKSFSIFVIWVSSLSVALLPLSVFAQSMVLSQEQIDSLRASCSGVQIKLTQLQRSDAVSRINHGRDYDQMLTQIAALNSRLAYNKVNMPVFGQIASDMQATINQFRVAYDSYDAALDGVIKLTCKTNPVGFYEQVVKARDQRAVVNAEVETISIMATKYHDELIKYKDTLPESLSTRSVQ